MKRDDKDSASIFFVEPSDEKQTILNELRSWSDHQRSIVIVLKSQPTKAFQSPKDFHDLKLLKRQLDLSIIFVIPKGSFALWASTNGFPVYSSLETLLVTSTASESSLSASLESDLEANPLFFPDPPTSYAIPPVERDYSSHYDPITPLPPLPEGFFDFAEPSFASQEKQAEASQEEHSQPAKAPKELSTPGPAVPARQTWRPRRLSLVLILSVVTIGLIASTSLLFITQKVNVPSKPASSSATAATGVVGQLYFLSTGQLGQMGNNGINDKIELSLSHLSSPSSSKSYYAWLLSDADVGDETTVLLGKLSVTHGAASITYADPQHADLLLSMSRFLITEEGSNPTPVTPSPDTSTWRYMGIISQQPDPNTQQHFSLLDHLRHLLAAEPVLEAHGLHGGLSLWFYSNSGKLLEWARNAQDDGGSASAVPLMRRQIIRVLDYLDGAGNVNSDVPAHTPWLVDIPQGSIGLLQTHAEQDPPSYMEQIGSHLSGLLTCPGATAQQRQLATQIHTAIDNVYLRFTNARQDAKQLLTFSDKNLQSQQAQTLLNDMVTQLTDAYVGTIDPMTNAQQHGVVWIFDTMPSLGVISIQMYKASSSGN